MSEKSTGSFVFCRRGLTLIEVVASALLLSTLLAAVVLAHGRHVRQVKRAQQRLAAVQAADGLMAAWFDSPAGVPRTGRGTLSGLDGPTFQWSTRPIALSGLDAWVAEAVRLEVVELNQSEESPPIVTVELLVEPGRETPRGETAPSR